jgi:hypothetical protein
MAITKRNPHTALLTPESDLLIWDADHATGIETYQASAAITPGMTVELHDNSGELNWRPTASDTELMTPAVAVERTETNQTIDDDYAIGATVKVAWLRAGSVIYGIIPSGQDISDSEFLQSNGDGKLPPTWPAGKLLTALAP